MMIWWVFICHQVKYGLRQAARFPSRHHESSGHTCRVSALPAPRAELSSYHRITCSRSTYHVTNIIWWMRVVSRIFLDFTNHRHCASKSYRVLVIISLFIYDDYQHGVPVDGWLLSRYSTSCNVHRLKLLSASLSTWLSRWYSSYP